MRQLPNNFIKKNFYTGVFYGFCVHLQNIYFLKNICSISFCRCELQEKTTEKSTVDSIVFSVTVLHYNLIPHQGVLIQKKIPLKTQCFRSQHCQMISVILNLISEYTRKNLICSLTLKNEEGFYTMVPYFLNFNERQKFIFIFFSV